MKTISFLVSCLLFLVGCSSSHLDIFPELDDPALMQEKIAPELLHQDIDAFISGVKQRHPNFSGYADEVKLDLLVEELKANIKTPMTRKEFFRYIGRLSHVFQDGHSFLIWPYQELNYLQKSGEKPFPFSIDLTKNGVFVPVQYASENQKLYAGSQIISINGLEISKIFSEAQHYVGGETQGLREAFVAERFSQMLWAVYGFIGQFEVEVSYQGQRQTLHIDSNQSWQPADAEPQHNSHNLAYKRLISDVGYLNVDSFDVEPSEFATKLDNTFSRIQAEQVKALIIDIRNNTGGNTDTATELARYIADKPFRLVSKVTEKLNQDNRGLFGYKGQPGDMVTKDWNEYVEPIDTDQHFDGKVVVLIGPVSYSAAIVFATTVQDSQFGLLAGQPTGGFANQSAQGNLFNLPHSQLRAYVATRLLVRPSGNIETTAVEPDLVVDYTLQDQQNGVDTLLEHVLKSIDEMLAETE
ncbi:MAG: S41 family peptidase [Kangiella sp.]|nr:S41 family peptidase [Kangiella sp.]